MEFKTDLFFPIENQICHRHRNTQRIMLEMLCRVKNYVCVLLALMFKYSCLITFENGQNSILTDGQKQ